MARHAPLVSPPGNALWNDFVELLSVSKADGVNNYVHAALVRSRRAAPCGLPIFVEETVGGGRTAHFSGLVALARFVRDVGPPAKRHMHEMFVPGPKCLIVDIEANRGLNPWLDCAATVDAVVALVSEALRAQAGNVTFLDSWAHKPSKFSAHVTFDFVNGTQFSSIEVAGLFLKDLAARVLEEERQAISRLSATRRPFSLATQADYRALCAALGRVPITVRTEAGTTSVFDEAIYKEGGTMRLIYSTKVDEPGRPLLPRNGNPTFDAGVFLRSLAHKAPAPGAVVPLLGHTGPERPVHGSVGAGTRAWRGLDDATKVLVAGVVAGVQPPDRRVLVAPEAAQLGRDRLLISLPRADPSRPPKGGSYCPLKRDTHHNTVATVVVLFREGTYFYHCFNAGCRATQDRYSLSTAAHMAALRLCAATVYTRSGTGMLWPERPVSVTPAPRKRKADDAFPCPDDIEAGVWAEFEQTCVRALGTHRYRDLLAAAAERDTDRLGGWNELIREVLALVGHMDMMRTQPVPGAGEVGPK